MVTKNRNASTATSRKKLPTKKPLTVETPQKANGNGISPSNEDVLREFYTSLLRCRMVQQHAQDLRSFGTSRGPYDLAIGHEAIVVGTIAKLQSGDTVAASPRNLAAQIARGVALSQLLDRHDGAATQGTDIASVTTSDPFNLGTGTALTHKLEKKGNVVIALCQESSPSLASWQDALQFAGVHKLPIVYVIQSTSENDESPGRSAHFEDFSFMARDYGFPGIVVDGRDVVAVWRVAQESIHRGRNGSGPTLVECTLDSGQDPVAYLEHYMRKRRVWDEKWKNRVAHQLQAEIAAATDARGARSETVFAAQ